MKRKFFNIFIILAITLTTVTSVFAQDSQAPAVKDEARSFIVVMRNDPLIAYEGEIGQFSATKPDLGEKINLNSSQVQAYQTFLEKTHEASLAAAGVDASAKVNTYTVALNGYSAILTEAEAKAIKSQSGVAMVLEDQMRYIETDSSPQFLGLTVRGGAYDTGFTGEGVVVGIIDTGIWPEHPSFADDGTFPAPPNGPLPCEFGNTAHNPADVPFTCNNKLIGADQVLDTYRAVIGADPTEFNSARDDGGHGTHTASTAAGNAGVDAVMYGFPVATISGIAPRAHVIAYKGLGALGGFTSDLAAAIDRAVADGVDVINYSIGGGAGGPGADEIAFLFAAEAGVFVATSAGNSGPGAATLGNPGTMPWMTTVGASTQKRFFAGIIKLGNRDYYTGASLTDGIASWEQLVDAEFAGGDLCIPGTLDPSLVEGKIVLCRRGSIARADKSLAVFQAGGVGMIMYNNNDVDNLATNSHWVPSVHVDQTVGLAIKAYIAAEDNPIARIATRTPKGPLTRAWPYAPSMTIFSSRGPNPVVPDLIKPDVTAPGTQILAGYSPLSTDGIPGEMFAAIQGTSMSSPHVAGVFALLKQAHPEWSAAAAKSALMTTSYQKVLDNDRFSPADPFDMGAGHIKPGGVWHRKGSIVQPGLVYDAGLYEYAAFTCGMNWGVFTPGSCVFLEGLGIPFEPYNLNLPSIGVSELAGSQTVVRTVTNVAETKAVYIANVAAPPGYDVTVHPNWMKLDPGESATFEVVITNNGGGAVGEWSFGSLTWKGSGFNVRSPIAVRGALFSAPSGVSSVGETGSASFDVQFGYTGSYAAAPHGLIADAPTSGEIGQDPDQTYPSGDNSPVGVQRIDFPVTGAAFLRWSLVIPGDDDIDLFLENSAGNIIASSTAGGTDELIEVVLPADDTYTLVVHGWSVPNEPLPYTLHYWEVPLASGGSLVVDSAPASAVLGATETIDLSWSGLTAGTSYLGAVSHTGDVGLMGFTLVEVDVP